jgi:hypothetical protein
MSKTTDQARIARMAAEELRVMQRAVDAVHINAVSVVKLSGMEIHEAPRLLVSGACRTVERLMESYQDRLTREAEGGPAMSAEEKATRKTQIAVSLQDLLEAMAEGATMCQTLQKALGVEPVQH